MTASDYLRSALRKRAPQPRPCHAIHQIKNLTLPLFMVLLTSHSHGKYFLHYAPGKKVLNPPKPDGTLLLLS